MTLITTSAVLGPLSLASHGLPGAPCCERPKGCRVTRINCGVFRVAERDPRDRSSYHCENRARLSK
jgi:hypothetical protein